MLAKRGDVIFAEIRQEESRGTEEYKDRPWLVVSADRINEKFPLVIAVPLVKNTDKKNRYHRILIPASEIVAEPGHEGMAIDRLALTEQVRILAEERLTTARVARISTGAMAAVEAGLAYVLDIP